MILERIGAITERIGNLLRVYDSGLIDAATYTKELRALQDEFLSPESIDRLDKPALQPLNL